MADTRDQQDPQDLEGFLTAGQGDEDDDADVVEDLSLSLSPPVPDEPDEDEPEPQAGAREPQQEPEEEPEEEDLDDDGVLARVAGAIGLQPAAGAAGDDDRAQLRREVDELRAQWQARDDVLSKIIKPPEEGEPKQPGPIELLASPQMERIVREALESDEPGALNKVLVSMADRIAKVRAEETVGEVRTELEQLKSERAVQQDVDRREKQIGAAVMALEARGGTARQLARDLRKRGTESYLWQAWHREGIPNITVDGQMMAVIGIGLADLFDVADTADLSGTGAPGTTPAEAGDAGQSPAEPAARPAARTNPFDGGTGTRARATRREPSQPNKQPTNDELAENVFAALKRGRGRRGSTLLDGI